jgi:WD40 repeat protein
MQKIIMLILISLLFFEGLSQSVFSLNQNITLDGSSSPGQQMSHTGDYIFAGTNKFRVEVYHRDWGSYSHVQTLSDPTDHITDIDVSGDDQVVVLSSFDGNTYVYKMKNDNYALSQKLQNNNSSEGCSVAITLDGRWLSVGTESNVDIYWHNTKQYTYNHTLTGHNEYVYGLAFSADHSVLIVGDHSKYVYAYAYNQTQF